MGIITKNLLIGLVIGFVVGLIIVKLIAPTLGLEEGCWDTVFVAVLSGVGAVAIIEFLNYSKKKSQQADKAE